MTGGIVDIVARGGRGEAKSCLDLSTESVGGRERGSGADTYQSIIHLSTAP